jgi:hypothetical protein
MAEEKQLQMKMCGCCDEPGLCVFDTFWYDFLLRCCCFLPFVFIFLRFAFQISSPCFTIMEAADNIDESGLLYCVATVCGFGCCALAALGEQVGKKRDLDISLGSSCFNACCNCFTCWSCRLVNEARLYKETAGAPVAASAPMERK